MTIKDFFNVLKNILITIFTFVGGVFLGKTIFSENNSQIEESKEYEIKNLPATDVLDQSTDTTAVNSTIDTKQTELRKRIRDRLNKKL